jgi:hypothetical protein
MKGMLTKTLTLAIAAAIGIGPVAMAYDPRNPDIGHLPMEVLGPAKSPKLVISRLKAIDNLDANILQADRADFFVIVFVNDIEHRTGVMSMDDGRPNWEVPLPAIGDPAVVRIRVMDDDGGLESGDDHVDISRAKDKKDVIFTWYPSSRTISGDLNGRQGQSFYTRGWYDGDKAHLWFSIQ